MVLWVATNPVCYLAALALTSSMLFPDEKDKENSRPSPFLRNKDCKEKGISLAACPVKILALPQMEEAQNQCCRAEAGTAPVAPQHRAQKAPASPTPLPDSWLLRAEPHSKGEASCGTGDDCCFFSFTQDSEGNRIIAHRNALDLFAGETLLARGSVTSDCGTHKQEDQPPPEAAKARLDFQLRLGVNQKKKPQQSSSVNSLIAFTEAENINPTLTRDSPWAAGLCPSAQRAAGAQPLSERSRNASAGPAEEGRSSPFRQLFTQDSQGHRVIAHRCRSVPSPRRASGSSGGRPPSSPRDGCPSDAASLSAPWEQQLDVCYDLLFTQDSEGNRVIKHW